MNGFSRHTSSSITSDEGRDYIDVTCKGTENCRAISLGALTSRRSEPSSSDDDESGWSDSEIGSDSNGDESACEEELSRSDTRMNIRWDPIHEQRLLAYQDISDISADNKGFVIVGVANNVDIKDLRSR